MITLKELKYVSTLASNVPYPGISYAELAVEKLLDSVEMYEKFYQDRQYDLILSNGEQLEFEIASKNLCHMLGIEFKNLTNDYFTEFRRDVLGLDNIPKSYELLKAIINNIDKVLKYDLEHSYYACKILNYYRIMVKCAIFEKLSDFSRFDFGVINFNKDVYHETTGRTYSGNAEKFLYVQSNEYICPYFMMGILKTDTKDTMEEIAEHKGLYAVETLFAPNGIKGFFENQNVCIPTQIIYTTSNEMIKKEASPSNKIALLNQYKAIVNEYGIANNMEIYADYLAMLSSQESQERSSLVKKR